MELKEKMRNTLPMKVAKTGYVVISSALCVIGLFMTILPDFSIALVGTLLGVVMIVFGVIKIIGYWSKDLFRLAFQYDFAFGILIIALGVYALSHPSQTVSFFYIILGVVILADGMLKLQIAIDARKFGLAQWWMILVLALAAGVVGCFLIFHPVEGAKVSVTLVGVSLFAEGALNLCVVLSTVKIVEHQHMDEI